jgi:putative phage-type endonuclease
VSVQTPTGVHLGTWETGSPEWLEVRRNGVGGSEVSAILGLSPFDSRFALYHRKVGTLPPLDLKDEMEWGHRLEPVIARKYSDTHPEFEVVTCGTYAHRSRPWQILNPDRLALSSGAVAKPVELKYSLYGDGWGRPGTEEIPIYYRTQSLWYLDGLGLDEIDVAVFIGGAADYREYTIHANPAEVAQHREAVKDFLDDIDTGTLPNLDGHTATYQAVKELHPDIDGSRVEVPTAIALAYIEAARGKKTAETAGRYAAAQLADYIGGAQHATWNGIRIASRQARGDGTPYLVAARNLDQLATTEGTAA